MIVHRQTPIHGLTALGATLIAVLGCVLVVGCSRGSSEPEVGVETPPPTAEEIAAERKADYERRLKTQINKARTRIASSADDYPGNMKMFRGILRDAHGTKHEAAVQEILDGLQKGYEKRAQVELDAAITEADENNKSEDHRAAIDALEDWNSGDYADMPMHATWKQKLAEARLYEAASQDIGQILKTAREYRSQQDIAIAIAYLESYPDRYESTTYHTRVRGLIDEYYEAYQSVKVEKEAVLDVPWTDDEIDEYLTAFSARAKDGAEVWKGSGDGIATGDNTTDAPAHLLGGEDEWLEFILEFEVKIGEDQDKLQMGIHKNFDFKTKQMLFMSHAIPLEPDRWYKLRIEVAEGQIKISDEDDPELYKSTSGRMGGYAFLLEPGEKVWIRNFRHKVLQAAEKADEKGDGAAEK